MRLSGTRSMLIYRTSELSFQVMTTETNGVLANRRRTSFSASTSILDMEALTSRVGDRELGIWCSATRGIRGLGLRRGFGLRMGRLGRELCLMLVMISFSFTLHEGFHVALIRQEEDGH